MISIEKKIRQIFDINKNDDKNKEVQIHKSFKKNLYETNQNPRQNEFLKYISMTKNEFIEICDAFRPDHLWKKKSNRWELKLTPAQYFNKIV